MASLAWTRMVSPTLAVTRATLTVSSPAPVSTTAISSASSRTTVTCTAVSEQVMQVSPLQWFSVTLCFPLASGALFRRRLACLAACGGGPSRSFLAPQSRRRRAPLARSRDHPRGEHSRLLEEHVYQLPEYVVGGHVQLLDHPGIRGGRDQEMIDRLAGRD